MAGGSLVAIAKVTPSSIATWFASYQFGADVTSFFRAGRELVWEARKDPDQMKGKRYTTEDKIHVLREGDRDKSILEGCRQHNISEAGFHRWKRQFS